jgi:hypothetical protein
MDKQMLKVDFTGLEEIIADSNKKMVELSEEITRTNEQLMDIICKSQETQKEICDTLEAKILQIETSKEAGGVYPFELALKRVKGEQ